MVFHVPNRLTTAEVKALPVGTKVVQHGRDRRGYSTELDCTVTKAQCQEWASLYPAVDVIQQFRNMKGWLKANPTRRKTKRGINKFINGWLSKEQDRARPSGPGNAQKSLRPEPDVSADARNMRKLYEQMCVNKPQIAEEKEQST